MQLKRIIALTLAAGSLAFAPCLHSSAQTLDKSQIDQIIRKFAAAESENKIARNNYLFTQDVDIRTLGPGGVVTGQYKRVSEIVLDNMGNRFEKITHFPPSTLREISLTQEDLQDLAGVQPFALTAEDLPKYIVTYTGKEKIDELDTYVFDVRPAQIKKGERYLEGRIWVDDHDLQIVKVAGKAVPEVGGQKFPRFESYRENIDQRYWFPTYVYSDDVLEFKHSSVHLRMTVRYTKYKKFSTDIRLVDEGAGVATDEDVKSADKTKGDAASPKDDKTKPAGQKKEDPKPKEKKPPQD